MDKYVTLKVYRGSPSWGLVSSEWMTDKSVEAYKVTDTNDEHTALRTKLGHYLLGHGYNQKWFDSNRHWSAEVALDCMLNPEKYRDTSSKES